MDLSSLQVAVAILVVLAWLLKPYFDWGRASARSLDAHIARTSFQCTPGELVPPVWKAPELMLSVVVPAFNEEYRLPQMLDETLTYLEARAAMNPLGFSYEVLVVDDGSTDGTYAAALGSFCRQPAGTHGELRVMQLVANRGKGFAVRAGMLVARGQLLLMADADGATNIRDLERLEQALGRHGEDGAQIAFGSRYHLKDEPLTRRSLLRKILMIAFHLIVWIFMGGPVYDTQCGFKLFRAGVGKRLFGSLHVHRWAFDIELVILAHLLGAGIAEVPVTWVDMPGSKFNLTFDALTMFRDIIVMHVLYITRMWHPSEIA